MLRSIVHRCLTLPILLVLGGCQSSFERYYVPASPTTSFAPVEAVTVLEVGTQDALKVQQDLYASATLVGTSRFNSSHLLAEDLRRFAATIGADLAIWSQRWIDSTTSTGYDLIPRSETTRVVTEQGGQRTETKVRTDRWDHVPYTTSTPVYEHHVLYLRRQPTRDDVPP